MLRRSWNKFRNKIRNKIATQYLEHGNDDDGDDLSSLNGRIIYHSSIANILINYNWTVFPLATGGENPSPQPPSLSHRVTLAASMNSDDSNGSKTQRSICFSNISPGPIHLLTGPRAENVSHELFSFSVVQWNANTMEQGQDARSFVCERKMRFSTRDPRER